MSARQAQIAALKKQLNTKAASAPLSVEEFGAATAHYVIDAPIRIVSSFWKGLSEQAQLDHLTRKLDK